MEMPLQQEIIFIETPPASNLAPYISTYWQGDFNVNAQHNFSQSVLPNGCLELIVHLTEDHCVLAASNTWSASPEFVVMGLYNRSYDVRFTRNVKVFGVRFFPDGIRHIFGVPPSVFFSMHEDSTTVFGRHLARLCQRLREAHDTATRIQLANVFFSAQLSHHALSRDYTRQAMSLIRRSGGVGEYQHVLKDVPISQRQLQREFKAVYGITPRDYMRIIRMSAIQRYMMATQLKLSQITYDLNFTDQSHLIKEFKTFAGVPPRMFAKARSRYISNPPALPE